MDSTTIVLIVQTFVFVVQTVVLTWYANETVKIRKDAAHQNELLGTQLKHATRQNDLLAAQLETMQADFKRKVALEDNEADLNLVNGGGGGHNGSNERSCQLFHIGGIIQVLEYRSTVPRVGLTPTPIWQTNTKVTITLSADVKTTIYFGIKYRTKYNDIKSQVFVFDPNAVFPKKEKQLTYESMALIQSFE